MKVKYLARAACVAALYVLLTLCFMPFSFGPIQCRVSEALCVLPYLCDAAVPGLFVGCALANLLAGAPLYDVVFGSLATLLAALCTYWLRKRAPKILAPLPSVLINALVIGAVLVRVYGLETPFWLTAAYVGAGQTIACFALGIPLLLALERFPKLWR